MTYWCFNCNTAVRDDEMECKEGHTQIDGRTYRNPYEDEYFCPNCGEEFYAMEEAKECPICGEYMNPDREICEECETELKVYIEQMLDGYALDKGKDRDEAEEDFNYYLKEMKGWII